MHFCCSELIVVTLIKQTNTTFVNLRGAFICFILCHTILSSKVFSRFKNIILVEKCWDCYQLTGLFSSFFKSLVKISQPLSHFGIFIANKKEGISHQRIKFQQSKDLMCSHKAHAMPLYYYVFLMFSYSLKMFLLAMFGKLIIVLLESSLYFETAVKQFETS